MTRKLISIIMPVKDAEAYIKDSVESILSQSYGDFELLIIDDGSADRTAEIAESYKDKRIQLYKRENLGLVEQLNYGLSKSKGDYIARMDADDIALPEKLQLQIDFLEKNKDIHIAGTNFEFIDAKGKTIMFKKLPEFHNDIEFMMPFIDSVLHSSILTYKKVLVDSGGYDRNFSSVEDDELFLRLLTLGYKMHNIQKTLYRYRLIERPYGHYEMQNAKYYGCGIDYLENRYKEKNGEYYLRLGLLEYYRGSIKSARINLLNCLKYKEIKKRVVFRYLPVTFLGTGIVNYLRRKKITSKINSFFNNKFRVDTYGIEGAKVNK